MTLRFMKCLVVVALVHVFAAALVFGAYHFTKAGNPTTASNAPADRTDFAVVSATDTTEKKVEEAPKQVKHVVQSGESYWSIAKKYKVRTKDLMSHNNHQTGHLLRRGEVLVIPNQ